jgi:hypothetical protein
MGYKQYISGNIHAHPVLDGPMPVAEKILLENAVSLARRKLDEAVRGLQIQLPKMRPAAGLTQGLGEPLSLLLRTCFMISAQNQSEQLPGLQIDTETSVQNLKQKIEQVLEKLKELQKNLNGPIEIVDLPKSDWSENRRKYEAEAQKVAEKKEILNPDKDHAAALPKVGLMGYVRGAIPLLAGPIHICFAYLFDEPGTAWTIVHEATHKYLGTADNAYWTGDVTGKWAALTCDQACDNADSYARFVMEFDFNMIGVASY